MDEHYLHDVLGAQDHECMSDVFLSRNQRHSMQIRNPSELPRIMGPNIPNSFRMHKDHMYNLELKPTFLKEKLVSSNDISSTIQTGSEVVSRGQMTDYAESYGRSTEDFIGVEIQEHGNEGELLLVDVDESVLMIDDPFCENDDGTSLNVNSAHADNNEQDCEWLPDTIQFILGKEGSNTADFIALDSDKAKNPPYLIKDTINIITKNNEPIKFCIQGAASDQIVTVTMQYTEEKFKNNPVLACKLDQKDEDAFPFLVSTAGEEIELKKEKIHDHPKVFFSLPAEHLDNGCFNFYLTVLCLNSCHKTNGKKIQLIMKLFDPRENKIIKESRFNIRSCKNVKRDYKEAFLEAETLVKRPKPDSFISPIESQTQPSIVKEEVKPRSRNVNMVVTKPPVQEVPEKKVITCMTTKSSTLNERKFYLVQLPSAETEKNVLETIRLLGGNIQKLESLYPVHDDDTNPNLVSDPE